MSESPSHNPDLAQKNQPSLLNDFLQSPDESHFQKILAYARTSTNPRYTVIWQYDQLSKKLTPVDNPSIDVDAISKSLHQADSADFQILEQIMLAHPNPWRRWTIAKVLGMFAGKASIPSLAVLLNANEDYVRNYAKEAIDDISSRSK